MAKTKNRRPITDAAEIMDRRYFEGKPEMLALLEKERDNAEMAQKVYDLRTAAGLSQRELAKRVGTTPSVICRLEDANYEGHSLSLLRRIAAAIGKRVEVNFVPAKLSPPQALRHGVIRMRRTKKGNRPLLTRLASIDGLESRL